MGSSEARPRPRSRVAPDGKHLTLDGAPYRVRGATYGTFAAREDGELFPDRERVRADFAAMSAAGLNVVRTYTTPPPDVLDDAAEAGLRVLVGIHFDDWRMEETPGRAARKRVLERGRRALEEAGERCAGRPEVLALAVGNEVPADVVRVHGIGAVEDGLSQLAAWAHELDPELLVTYANFPTTEYLKIDGLDLVSFNVFLEQPAQLRAYLRHLQLVAADLPLLITELGLAAAVHGEDAQAASLEWQLRSVDEAGCAGATVFSWTDEWWVGEHLVEGWGFGLTDSERRPRPALDVVSRWAAAGIEDLRPSWPTVSVVVCAYNAGRTLERCLDSLAACSYPELEVIVCDDGSSDDSREIAERYPFRLIRLAHGGLSQARNAGISASSGSIVAFLDADATCHPEWPFHLALSLEEPGVAGTGGPNLPVADAGFVERAVAASPGSPVEVLFSDDRAEHVPGCNMAFRREALEAIGGFDPIYTAAGDDVDVCWKLLESGAEIAFAPAAQVRHRRRDTIRGYLRQQRGYGRAERLLSGRYRHRFNALGQARWAGFVYSGARLLGSVLHPVVYHGRMGSAPFQPVVVRRSEAAAGFLGAYLPLLVLPALLGVFAFASPWWLLGPALAVVLAVMYGVGVALGVRPSHREARPSAFRLLVGFLHVVQPFVRTWGRLAGRAPETVDEPRDVWRGDRLRWLEDLRRELGRLGCRVRTSEHAPWDLECSVGPLLKCRLTTAVMWSWQPLHRAVLRPRMAVGVAPFAVLALASVSAWAALGGLSAFAVGAVVEAARLRSRVASALARTTAGARTNRELTGLQAHRFAEDLHPRRVPAEPVRADPAPAFAPQPPAAAAEEHG